MMKCTEGRKKDMKVQLSKKKKAERWIAYKARQRVKRYNRRFNLSFALNENNLSELKRRQVKHEVKIRERKRAKGGLQLWQREKVKKTIQPLSEVCVN